MEKLIVQNYQVIFKDIKYMNLNLIKTMIYNNLMIILKKYINILDYNKMEFH